MVLSNWVEPIVDLYYDLAIVQDFVIVKSITQYYDIY